jgi:O-acetyl-ADP-ribose deacetylase (regulator of RNase III)/uncharacterized protein YwgA
MTQTTNIRVLVGDIFESRAQTLVNTVNCVGVMGKGVALGFKKRFPEMFEDYVAQCQRGEVKLGKPYLFKRRTTPWVLNFPTKDHWRSVARIQDIVHGLEFLETHHRSWGIESIAVPPLGCGEGGLEWTVVGPTLVRHLRRLSIPVELYAPYGTPGDQLQLTFLERTGPSTYTKRLEPAWVALVEALAKILDEPYHPPLGRTSFQKVAYFATEGGIPTGLDYRRGSYGPFAPTVKRITTSLINNGLITEQRLGRMLAVKLGPTFRDARRTYEHRLTAWSEQIERVADLFMRMDTRQAETAATVHFAAKELQEQKQREPTETEVLREVMEWKQRRRPPLDEIEVAKAIRNLGIHGWLQVKPSPDLPVPDETFAEAEESLGHNS